MQSNIISLILTLLIAFLSGSGFPDTDVSVTPSSVSQASQVPSDAKAEGRKMVLGYFVDGTGPRSSLSALTRNTQQITDVSGFWYTFDESGAVVGRSNPSAIAKAKASGIGVYPLVHNIQHGRFNKQLADTVLSNAQRRQRLVAGVAGLAWSDGAEGVVIDIEDLYPSNRLVFQAFLRELRSAVGHKKTIIVAVPAKTRDDQKSSWTGAFDYAAIGQVADHLALMTYDQHTLGSGPGPVASYQWDEEVVRYAVSRVAPRQVLLGLAGYGYRWVGGKALAAVTHPEVVKISQEASAPTMWSEAHQSPYLKYWDSKGQKNEVWFENHQSLGKKLELVDRYGLQGVALWRLGQEDQRLWARISSRWPS